MFVRHSNGGKYDHQEDNSAEKERGNFTEVDLVPRRPRKPSLKDSNNEDSERSSETLTTANSSTRRPSSPPIEESNDECCINCTCCPSSFKNHCTCKKFSVIHPVFYLCAIAIFVFDLVTDILVAAKYFNERELDRDFILFYRLTVAFIVGPSLIIQLFSLVWFIADFQSTKNSENSKDDGCCVGVTLNDFLEMLGVSLLHLFQVAVLLRYFQALAYGFKSRYCNVKKEDHQKKFDEKWKREVNDVSFLRLLESFFESAPQLVIQLYVMITKEVTVLYVLSCIFSLSGLSFAIVSSQRAIRDANAENVQLSIKASIVMFLWRAFTISSRVLAFSLFLVIFPLVFLIIASIHWFAAFLSICIRGTDFCPKKYHRCFEVLFDAVSGFVYIFCFLNVHEAKGERKYRSRYAMSIFYLVVMVENSIFSFIWFFSREEITYSSQKNPMNNTLSLNESVISSTILPASNDRVVPYEVAVILVAAVHVFFLFGIVFMFLYYTRLHPKKDVIKRFSCCVKDQVADKPRDENEETENLNEPMLQLRLISNSAEQQQSASSIDQASSGSQQHSENEEAGDVAVVKT